MAKPVMLDTGPLGRIAHPSASREIASWFVAIVRQGFEVIVPEIADDEFRPNVILEGLTESVDRLNDLEQRLKYLPLSMAHMRKAGQPTSDDKSLDGDVILAAQALSVEGVVANENVGHLARFCVAKHWKDVTADVLA